MRIVKTSFVVLNNDQSHSHVTSLEYWNYNLEFQHVVVYLATISNVSNVWYLTDVSFVNQSLSGNVECVTTRVPAFAVGTRHISIALFQRLCRLRAL